MGTVTVFMVFQTAMELIRNLAASSLGAIALMLSHSLWWHSTMVEVYTLNTALMTGMIYLIVRYSRTRSLYHLYGALLCWGLGIANLALVLGAVSTLAAGGGVLSMVTVGAPAALIAVAAVLGAGVFALYTISLAYTYDRVPDERIVSALVDLDPRVDVVVTASGVEVLDEHLAGPTLVSGEE